MSILSVMVALSIGTIVVIASSSLIKNGYKAQKSIEQSFDRIALRNYIMTKLDCAATMPARPTACNSNGYIALNSSDGVLVAHPSNSGMVAKKIGDYSLRAKCVTCSDCSGGKKILVEHARLRPDGTFKKDPATGRLAEWRDLFKGVPLGCPVPP